MWYRDLGMKKNAEQSSGLASVFCGMFLTSTVPSFLLSYFQAFSLADRPSIRLAILLHQLNSVSSKELVLAYMPLWQAFVSYITPIFKVLK